MCRRLLLLLLILLAPLQALAALQMGLSAFAGKDHSHLHVSVVHSEQHADARHEHHAQQAGASSDSSCADCNLCVPPLAFTLQLKLDNVTSSAVSGPMPSLITAIPRFFDRPPRPARLT